MLGAPFYILKKKKYLMCLISTFSFILKKKNEKKVFMRLLFTFLRIRIRLLRLTFSDSLAPLIKLFNNFFFSYGNTVSSIFFSFSIFIKRPFICIASFKFIFLRFQYSIITYLMIIFCYII